MSEEIVSHKAKFVGYRGYGLQFVKAYLDNGTVLNGFGITFAYRTLVNFALANDGGWYDSDTGKIHNFYYDTKQDALFIRWFAIGFPFIKRRRKKKDL